MFFFSVFALFAHSGVMLMTECPEWPGLIDPTSSLLVRTSGPWIRELIWSRKDSWSTACAYKRYYQPLKLDWMVFRIKTEWMRMPVVFIFRQRLHKTHISYLSLRKRGNSRFHHQNNGKTKIWTRKGKAHDAKYRCTDMPSSCHAKGDKNQARKT